MKYLIEEYLKEREKEKKLKERAQMTIYFDDWTIYFDDCECYWTPKETWFLYPVNTIISGSK